MGVFDKIKQKFQDDAHNENRMMHTESNEQKFGLASESDHHPRNNMMDTVSNEQGAKLRGKEHNERLNYAEEGNNANKNVLTHTLSNEQAEELSHGVDIVHDDSKPRNKLLDIVPNEGLGHEHDGQRTHKSNSDRVL